MQELNEIITLLSNENDTFKNISYKSVDRIKVNNINNNSFSNNKIRFNTQAITSKLVSYENSYILLEVDIKFAEEANALPAHLRLKNTYEMVSSLKIELNNVIISNEDKIYYSNIIPHLLKNSESNNILYRSIDLHDNVTFNTNANKNIFITNAGDSVTVKIPIFLKDISDYFRQLNFAHEFGEYIISLEISNEIYYKAANMNIESQTVKSAYLYTDVCYLDEDNKIEYLKNINKFNKTIPIFENHIRINNDKIEGDNFNFFVNNVRNCKNTSLFLIKDDSIVKIPNKSCSKIQMYIDNKKFQNPIDNNIDAFINFKNRSPHTNEFLLNYSQFLNNYLIYCFPLERMIKNDFANKFINIMGNPDNNSSSTGIIVFQQSAYINLKIENGSLLVSKTY